MAARGGVPPGPLLAVAIGGVVGALCPHGVTVLWPAGMGRLVWSVFAINITGCLLIGALMAVIEERPAHHPLLRPFVGVGVLGGFTTFSTYALDGVDLWRADEPHVAAFYLAGTLAAAVAAVVVGLGMTVAVLRIRRQR